MALRLLLAFLLLPLLGPTAHAQKSEGRVYGFFTSWSVYARNYHVPDVPAASLTHLVYMPANIVGGKIALADPYADTQLYYTGDSWAAGALRGSFNRMLELKKQHPHLKTLISIGGAGNSQGFSPAVATAAARTTFVISIVDFVVKYGFDGVDVNWEFPGSGPNPSDPQNYTLFLQDLRTALDAKGQSLSKGFEITIDLPPDRVRLGKIELTKIAPLVDAMHVMSFDYFVPEANSGTLSTYHNSSLYETSAPYSPESNVAWSIDHVLSLGVPASKLTCGLPLYGRGFAGVTGGQNGLNATYTGPTTSGTWAPGVYDYSDIESNYVGQNGFTRFFDARARSPWLWNANSGELISYEDASSLEEKAWQAKSRGLGGAMFWELSGDRSGKLVGAVRKAFDAPGLASQVGSMPVTRPVAVPMQIGGDASRAGRLYFVLLSFGDPRPGMPLPGGPLPIALDSFALTMLGQLNSPLFPGSLGTLDATGNAQASLRFDLLPSLPKGLAGQRMRAAAWILDAMTSFQGAATNPVMVAFRAQ